MAVLTNGLILTSCLTKAIPLDVVELFVDNHQVNLFVLKRQKAFSPGCSLHQFDC